MMITQIRAYHIHFFALLILSSSVHIDIIIFAHW